MQQRLQRYFAVETLRNPGYASRDYALYLLHIEHRADAALQIAWINWQSQREPEDAAIVLEAAAQRVGTGEETRAIQHWQQQTRLEDLRLTAVANAINTRAGMIANAP